jgi:O-antigen ligase
VYSAIQSWVQWSTFTNNDLVFERIDFLNSSNYFANHPEVSKSWVFFTYIGLANGVQLHPSYFSLFLAFCVVFLLLEHAQSEYFKYQRILNIVLIIVFLVALVLLSSRIIIFGIAVIFGALALHQVHFRQSRRRVALIFILLLAFVAGIFVNPISRHRSWEELTGMSYEVKAQAHYRTSSEIRASLWWLGWKSFRSVNPIFGTGASNVHSVMRKQSEQYQITNVLDTYDPHNQFLHVLIAQGILGLSMLTGIIAVGFRSALRKKNLLLGSLLVLFTLMCLTESVLELQKGIVFFTLTFSMLHFQSTSVETAALTSPAIISARS